MNSHTAPDRSLQALFRVGRQVDHDDCDILDQYSSGIDDVRHDAFRVLVDRHGPMVMAVCRSVLKDPHLADDAFQATFLVLARKAATIQHRKSLGAWLHGVALRVARRARAQAFRRRAVEQPLIGDVPSEGLKPRFSHEDLEVLHVEIGRLPRSLREPIVLCALESLTYGQAARLIGASESAVRGRLHRGRKRLEKRLRGRGIPYQAILPFHATEWLSHEEPSAFAMKATLKSVEKWLIGAKPGAEMGTSSVFLLAQGIVMSMYWTKVKMVVATVVVATSLVGSVTLGLRAQAPGTSTGKLYSAGEKDADKQTKAEQIQQRTEQINSLLKQKIDLGLPKDPSLEQFLKAIKRATSNKDYPGIPIYVSPDGMDYAGMTLRSRVIIEPGEKILAETLQQALKRTKLWYDVRDGFLMIDSRVGVMETRLQRVEEKLDRIIKEMESGKKDRPAK